MQDKPGEPIPEKNSLIGSLYLWILCNIVN